MRSAGEKYRFGYQGEFAEQDDETGWNAFELRMYDSKIGRWMATDPYGQYWSPYVGMGNNPINGVDPDGGLFGKFRAQIKAFFSGGTVGQDAWDNWVVTIDRSYTEFTDGVVTAGGVQSITIGNYGRSGFGGTGNFYNSTVFGQKFVNDWEKSLRMDPFLREKYGNGDGIEVSNIDFELILLFTTGGIGNAAKEGVSVVEKVAVHGNSLKSLRPTWGYKLYSQEGKFLKNGITSATKAEARYTKAFMSDKNMKKMLFPHRRAAYDWEFLQNQILRGPLNKNMH